MFNKHRLVSVPAAQPDVKIQLHTLVLDSAAALMAWEHNPKEHGVWRRGWGGGNGGEGVGGREGDEWREGGFFF